MGVEFSIGKVSEAQPQSCVFDAMADALAGPGWGVFPNVLDQDMLQTLSVLAQAQKFRRPARIGRRLNQRRNLQVRRDNIVWIDNSDPIQKSWLDWNAQLQLWLNRSLMMGLSFFESHYAYYAPNAFYAKHLDVFQGPNQQMLSERAVSLVLYLNPDWVPGHGGELVLYGRDEQVLAQIAPCMGTIALFNSADFVHEVLPTHVPRLSIAGWFHRQPASATALPVA
ncbi:MAG: 2OG-Fe(II) oxygenase [bacterium]